MTIEHSMQLTDMVEEYGVAGVIRELQQIVIEEQGEEVLMELGGEYAAFALGVEESSIGAAEL